MLLVPSTANSDAAKAGLNLDIVQVINIDGSQEGRTFEGIGALSAGASSRLLIDYPEPQRSEILDYLFKPNFGASIQHLKVEMGGDTYSTDGCESSYAHTRAEFENPKPEYYDRGYEWWLMKEARKRNPNIFLDALQLGTPGWIGNGKFYSEDNAEYIARFHKAARDYHGLTTHYQGIWNEVNIDSDGKWVTGKAVPLGQGWIDFVKLLRRTLDKYRLEDVKLVGADQVGIWEIVQLIHDDPELRNAVDVVGVHYSGYLSPDPAKTIGKSLWVSEDSFCGGDWKGARTLAKLANRNYILGKMVKTEIWPASTCYYDNMPCPGFGLMKANTPWSGHYEVQPPIWAMAHTTQFAKPGWKYIDSGCGINPSGSYVTLKSPDGSGNYSIVIETMDWPYDCAGALSQWRFKLKNLSKGPIHLWKSSESEQFVQQKDIVPDADGSFLIGVANNCIYTLTTTTGQRKGTTSIPADTFRFPFPYKEDFEGYGLDKQPRYISDQQGSFAVAERADGKGKCLRQLSLQKAIEWARQYETPWTELGDLEWTDYQVSAEVHVEGSGSAGIYGRIDGPQIMPPIPPGYSLFVDQDGVWQLKEKDKILSAGKIQVTPASWHRLTLKFKGSAITAEIDGQKVASVTDTAHVKGMVALGSSHNHVEFDNLKVEPLAER